MLKDKSALDEWKKVDAKVNLKARLFGLFIMLSQIPVFFFSIYLFQEDLEKSGFSSFLISVCVSVAYLIIMILLYSLIHSCPWCKKKISLFKMPNKGYHTCEYCNKNWRN